MRIVSENSEADIARERALKEIHWAVRELTANLLRVTRGAGRAYEIGSQAQSLVDAFMAYRAAAGYFPSSDEISRALSVSYDGDVERNLSANDLAWLHGERAVVRGSLQIAASRLLGQATQEAAGSSEMHKGLREIEQIREKNRKRMAVETPKERSGPRRNVRERS